MGAKAEIPGGATPAILLTDEERTWLARHPRIRVALDPDWAPVEYRDDQGGYRGLSLDYLGRLESLLGVDFQVVEGLSWQQAVAAVKAKQADMFASVSLTPQRQAYALFTRPYVAMPIKIFARSDIAYIGRLENLTGKRVAVVEGYAIHDWLKSEHPELQLTTVTSPPVGLQRVADGKADVFVGNVVTASYYLGKLRLSNVHIAGETPYANEQRMAVRDDWPLLASILQKGIDAIPRQERDAIYKDWLSIKFEHGYDYAWVVKALIGSALLFVIVLSWNRVLSRKVQSRTAQLKAELVRREVSENQLRASEEQLLQAQEIAQLGSWQVDLTTSVGIYSAAAQDILGIDLGAGAAVFPDVLLKILHQEDRPRVEKKIRCLGLDQDPCDTEYRINHPEKGVRYIHCMAKVSLDDSGRPLYLSGVVQDVTKRKEAEGLVQRIAAGVAASTGEAFFHILVSNLAEALSSPYVHIGELTADGEGVRTLAVWYHGEIISNYDYSLVGTPCENVRDQGLCIYPSGVQRRFPEDRPLQEMGFESYIGVPLLNTEGRPMGLMAILDDKPLQEPELAESLLRIFAVRAAAEMERLKHEGELRLAATMFENTTEAVIVTDSDAHVITVNKAFGKITGFNEEEVVGSNPRLWKSERHDEAFYQAMWASLKETRQWQGEIWNRRKGGDIYPAWMTINAIHNDQGQLTNYVSVFSDISAIKESEERLHFLAHHDPLTCLPNRLLFTARLEHALQHAHRQKRVVAVMFLDLDNFKQINDGLGHTVGDKVLQEVADRLAGQIREDDTVARMGGDEFAIILEDIEDSRRVDHVARKLLAAFDRPLEVSLHKLYVTATLGVSLYPHDGSGVAALVKNADTAMYRAKEQGKNRHCFYTMDLTEAAIDRLEMENDLREATDKGEFELYYQPQYALSDGRLVGAEALIRWPHDELGLVMPNKFIPFAESTGLIISIGRWVLHQACSQVKAWQQEGLEIGRIGVNVAGQQIQSGHFLETVEEVLAKTGLAPECLELEVTESFIMQQAEVAISTLEALRRLGVSLAIDDFGTGYSSLSYLKRLPIDQLKIDRSFIQDIPHDADGMAITKAVIALGKSMQMSIIAEGVETEAQKAFVLAEGCDEVQGYLYSRPVSTRQFGEMLRADRLASSRPAAG